MRVDNQPNQPNPVKHIAGMSAVGVGVAAFIKGTGLWDIATNLNPMSLFRKDPVDPATQAAFEEAQKTKQTALETLQGTLKEKEAEANAKAAEKVAAEAAVATAKKNAADADTALAQLNADAKVQNDALISKTADCTQTDADAATKLNELASKRAELTQALTNAKNKLVEENHKLQAANKALENAKSSAAAATPDVIAEKANLSAAAKNATDTAKAFVGEQEKSLAAFETQIQGETASLNAAKEACDKEIAAITAKVNELTNQQPNLDIANKTAFETLTAATNDLNGKAEIANAAEAARAQAQKAVDDAIYEDSFSKQAKETVSETKDWLATRVSNLTTWGKELARDNAEFLTATVGFAGTYYAVDLLASKHIKNSYARGAFSFAAAFVVVWTGSNFGFKNEMHYSTTLAYGAATIGATKVAIHAAPVIKWGISQIYKGADWVGNRKMTYTRE